MAPNKPDAFLSYTRFDDEDGEISAFRERLSRTVRQVSGEPFVIFQDVDDETGIALGQRWKDKLDEMLDKARFFIPILTPSFFRSQACRQELRTFLDLERKIGRRDLVLPIYWIACPVLEEGHLKAKDELAQEIHERQRWDWRELVFEDLRSAVCRRELHALSTQIERARRNVLRVVDDDVPAVAKGSGGQASASKTFKPRTIMGKIEFPPKKAKAKPAKPDAASSAPQQTQPLWKPSEVFKDIDEPWCPEMVIIPAGTFLMGSPENEKGRRNNEGPQHEATISKPFALGSCPVTFEEYDHFCDATGRERPKDRGWGRGRRPVINVSYDDALDYCTWLSEATGRRYQLPTEAMWEYACRAGTTTPFSFGVNITVEQVNFNGNRPYGGGAKGEYRKQTVPAGSLPANPWGLYEMHGNVLEWCTDAPRTFKPEPVTDPEGTGDLRAIRGGCWGNTARYVRSALRHGFLPDVRHVALGFRCARVH